MAGLSEEEIESIRASFEFFDKDKNGFITTSELRDVIKKCGSKLKEKDVKEMVKQFDVDKDGKINFDEFIQLMTVNFNNTDNFEENLFKAFKKFDKDGNGFISRSELKEAMRKLDKKITNEEIDDMLTEADTNMDGKIDYSEFVRIISTK
ncbi:unnamed protein product [Brachionus calyciflorus]|uniref:EF-hand domain-containing protein n=1 Tax=Brachionus calyciflorus TaxID=104777 RepID=A0A813SKL7_9BILA|nr:unnamed protein product [Brachionus calyciflorus]